MPKLGVSVVLALLRHIFYGAARSRISPRQPVHNKGATRRRITSLRIAGSVGRCVVSLRRVFIFSQPQCLEECEGDHGQQGVVMKTPPGAAFEVVEAELLLHLLVSLFARPSSFDRGDDLLA